MSSVVALGGPPRWRPDRDGDAAGSSDPASAETQPRFRSLSLPGGSQSRPDARGGDVEPPDNERRTEEGAGRVLTAPRFGVTVVSVCTSGALFSY